MRKSLLIPFMVGLLAGCLGTRPADTGDSGGDAGTDGSMTPTGGTGGTHVGGAGGSYGTGGGAQTATGGHGGTGSGGVGSGGVGSGGIGSGGVGSGGMGSGGMGSGGIGSGGMAMGGAGMGGHGGTGGSAGSIGIGGISGAGGSALLPPVLSSTTSKSFAGLAVGTASPSFSWMISNAAGASSTGPLTLTNDDPSEVTVTNGCTGPLAGGASCNVSATFRPNAVGARTAHVTVTASPGGTVTLTLTATGQVQITITTVGTGTVTSSPAGINCPGTCTASFSTLPVALQAQTTNGSNSLFTGWSDPNCPGPGRTCVQNQATASVAVTATFSALTANSVFTTSATFATNLGGAAAYDMACNMVASSAGLNNSAGNAFVAVVSDSNSNPVTRIGTTARGWVRMDGKPFADTSNSLFNQNQMFYPIVFQEDGTPNSSIAVMTATNFNGTAETSNCNNWTTNVNPPGTLLTAGAPNGGPVRWLQELGVNCGSQWPIICMGHTKSVAVTVPAPGPGRKIWLSNSTFTPGLAATPDTVCQASKPAGVTTAAALIATTTRTAASLLDAATSYYRVDGTFVGTGADIAAVTPNVSASALTAGIWQSGNGTYPIGADVWVGSNALTAVGTVVSTCGNWTDPTQTGGFYGNSVDGTSQWWDTSSVSTTCSSTTMSLYCVQTAP